ncbi:MAG: FliH/SctL family protein [Bdellovibrionota bacterium]
MSEQVATEEVEEQETPRASKRYSRFDDDMPFISQKDFRPTPYVPTTWELIGEQIAERDFVPLAVNVIHEDCADPDPMFEVFDPGISKSQDSFVHGGGFRRHQTEETADEAQVSAEMLASLEADFELRLAEARAQAYEEGAQAAQATIAERYEQLAARTKAITDAIYQQWHGLASRLERNAVDLSLQVAKKIIHTTVEVKPEYIIDVIREALSQLGAAKPVRIRVSGDDFEFLQVIGLPMDLSAQELGVVYLADENIKSGCVVETDFGELDLKLDRMWEQVKNNIYSAKK